MEIEPNGSLPFLGVWVTQWLEGLLKCRHIENPSICTSVFVQNHVIAHQKNINFLLQDIQGLSDDI
jgi:hypothetical protein